MLWAVAGGLRETSEVAAFRIVERLFACGKSVPGRVPGGDEGCSSPEPQDGLAERLEGVLHAIWWPLLAREGRCGYALAAVSPRTLLRRRHVCLHSPRVLQKAPIETQGSRYR